MIDPDAAPHFKTELPRPLRWATTGLTAVAGLGIFALLAITVTNVVKRKFTGETLTGPVEYTELILVAVVFFGLAGAEAAGSNIRSPVITNRLPSRTAHAVRTVATFAALVLVSMMTYESAMAAHDSIQTGEYRFGLVRTPLWPAKVSIPIGLGAFALVLAVEVVQHFRKWRRNEPREIVEFDGLP